MRGADLRDAAVQLRTVAADLTTAAERHADVGRRVDAVFDGTPDWWRSSDARRFADAGRRLTGDIAPLPDVLTDAAAGLRTTADEAEELGAELDRQLTISALTSHELDGLERQLAATDPEDRDHVQRLRTRRDHVQAERRAAERAIASVEARWRARCRSQANTIGWRADRVRRAAPEGVPNRLRRGGRAARRLTWDWVLAPLWPFERGITGSSRLRRAIGLASATVDRVAGAVAPHLTKLISGRWDRPPYVPRRGHHRRTPSGGRTWVRPHLMRNPNAVYTPAHTVPDAAAQQRVTGIGTAARRAGNVASFGFAAYDQWTADASDADLGGGERVGRSAAVGGATAVGAAVVGKAGAVAGLKAGAGIGAAVGSVVPGVGTVAGAAVGGVVGGIAGALVGGNVGANLVGKASDTVARAGGAVGSAVSSAANTVKGWFGG